MLAQIVRFVNGKAGHDPITHRDVVSAIAAGVTFAASIACLIVLKDVQKDPIEIRRPGDPVAWPWSK